MEAAAGEMFASTCAHALCILACRAQFAAMEKVRQAFAVQSNAASTPAQTKEALSWLERFQGTQEAWQVADHLRTRPRSFPCVVSAQWQQSGLSGPNGAGSPNTNIRPRRNDPDAAVTISSLHWVG